MCCNLQRSNVQQNQKKCLGKMGDVAKEGRTVLFVSRGTAVRRGKALQVADVVSHELHELHEEIKKKIRLIRGQRKES